MSYEVWEALGKPTHTPLRSYNEPSLGSLILKLEIQEQPMYCTFHVANLNETAEDAILGLYWMCQTKYQADEKDNTYSLKVNFVTLTGERSAKESKKILEVQPLQEASSKIMTILEGEKRPPLTMATFKE